MLRVAANNEHWQAGDFDLNINGSVVDADPDDGNANFSIRTVRGTYTDTTGQTPTKSWTRRDQRKIWTNDAKPGWISPISQCERRLCIPVACLDFVAHQATSRAESIPEIRPLETVFIEK